MKSIKKEYDAKQKELESKILPLLTKSMEGTSGMPDMSGMAGGMGGMPKPSSESHDEGPKIEEID